MGCASRGKIRRGLWVRSCNRDILHRQPFDTLGNHPRYFGLAICDLLRAGSVIVSLSWDQPFFDPIELPGGRKLVALRDAALYITKLPMAEHDVPEWQAAMQALMLVAEHDGPTMFARIGMMRALHRNASRTALGPVQRCQSTRRRVGHIGGFAPVSLPLFHGTRLGAGVAFT
jgi:hypothetical protein